MYHILITDTENGDVKADETAKSIIMGIAADGIATGITLNNATAADIAGAVIAAQKEVNRAKKNVFVRLALGLTKYEHVEGDK